MKVPIVKNITYGIIVFIFFMISGYTDGEVEKLKMSVELSQSGSEGRTYRTCFRGQPLMVGITIINECAQREVREIRRTVSDKTESENHAKNYEGETLYSVTQTNIYRIRDNVKQWTDGLKLRLCRVNDGCLIPVDVKFAISCVTGRDLGSMPAFATLFLSPEQTENLEVGRYSVFASVVPDNIWICNTVCGNGERDRTDSNILEASCEFEIVDISTNQAEAMRIAIEKVLYYIREEKDLKKAEIALIEAERLIKTEEQRQSWHSAAATYYESKGDFNMAIKHLKEWQTIQKKRPANPKDKMPYVIEMNIRRLECKLNAK